MFSRVVKKLPSAPQRKPLTTVVLREKDMQLFFVGLVVVLGPGGCSGPKGYYEV